MNKKYYIGIIGAATITFIIFFVILYIGTFNRMQPVVPEEELKREEMVFNEEENTIVQEEVILPTTEVTLRVVDNEFNTIGEDTINTWSVLGHTKKDIEERFKDFDVLVFNEQRVLLQKMEEVPPIPTEYRLGVEAGEIGIVTKGRQESFDTLGLSVKEFSAYTNVLLMNQLIQIDNNQKRALKQDPYYIEHIFQSYSE